MSNAAEQLIRYALEEDGAYQDVTSLSTISESQQATARLITRQHGVVSGIDLFAQVFPEIDPRVQVTIHAQNGQHVAPNDVLALVEGPARAILSGERVALNLLGHLSGVATVTAHCVAAIEGTHARILDTRKTTPGLRLWEKAAVRHGGGKNHRFNLQDGVLIKDNHIEAAGSILAAVEGARSLAHHLLRIEVECEHMDHVRQALEAGADAVLLDNMNTIQLTEAVRYIREHAPHVSIEASGDMGTDASRLAEVAATGVDFLSIGALTHSAPNFNVSLEIITH